MTSLWIEKYRPKSIEDYNCPAHLKNFLTKYKENFPHLLLYGPPGTGKTTFAHLISHKNKLELNASHERGINVIRGTIKNFASSISSKNTIILDECELLTPDAQQCLRRIIEDFTNTRFIFITNYPSKIILPLKSRLLALKFDYDNKEVLEKIKLQNSLNINVNDLVNLCNNDLRKAINAMQSIAPLKEYDMNMIFGQINEEELGLFFTDKNFASKFMRMNYCIINFINQLSDVLFSYGDESCVSEFLIVLSDVEEKAALGCNDEILLSYLVTKRIEIFK